jgi:AcrR family transcriptional regulator
MVGLTASPLVGGSVAAGETGITPSWMYSKWVQPPAQGRSERTFFRFLDAAEKLLLKRPWHQVSVQQIVKNADASVGSFYNRFTDKTALLHCLDDRIGEECEATIKGLIDELTLCPALVSSASGITVSLLMRLCTERAGVIRALDLARKMDNDNSFTGLGPRFDGALEMLASYLCSNDRAMRPYVTGTIVRAFRETFWLARETLLYENEPFDDAALHKTLMRHFKASLES